MDGNINDVVKGSSDPVNTPHDYRKKNSATFKITKRPRFYIQPSISSGISSETNPANKEDLLELNLSDDLEASYDGNQTNKRKAPPRTNEERPLVVKIFKRASSLTKSLRKNVKFPLEKSGSRPKTYFSPPPSLLMNSRRRFSIVHTKSSACITRPNFNLPVTFEGLVPNIASFTPLISDNSNWIIEIGSKFSDYNALFNSIEKLDSELYYQKLFLGTYHENYIGSNPIKGNVSISIAHDRKEGITKAIIRSDGCQKLVQIPNPNLNDKKDSKSIIKKILPNDWEIKNLRLVTNPSHIQDLINFENSECVREFKWGVLCCRPDQTNEDEIFANCEMSDDFIEFLDTIGKKIELRNWKNFSGGLDTTNDLTGTHSYYRKINDCQIMYHISALLPFDKKCEQQLERKRHIGNDIVVIVFLDDPKTKFTFSPQTICTHFQHILAVVQKDPSSTPDNTRYRFHVARKKGVPEFYPKLMNPSIYGKKVFRRILENKLIRAEIAAMKAPPFEKLIKRTRNELLQSFQQ